jgi:hypothetical protein
MKKLKYLLLLSAMFFIAYLLPAQNEISIKSIGGSKGEQLQKITPLSDGGWLMAGGTASEDGDANGKSKGRGDIWLVRLNAADEVLWQRRYGGAGREMAAGVAATENGTLLLTATVDSAQGDVKVAFKGRDIWVAALNTDGDLLWQRTLGGSGTDNAIGILPLADGGCMVYGNTNSQDGDTKTQNGSTDILLVRLDRAGKTVWSTTLGGPSLDFVQGLEQAADGSFFVLGSTFGLGNTPGKGALDALLMRVDATGKLLSAQTYGGRNDEEFTDLLPAPDGGYYLCGYTESSDGDATRTKTGLDMWLVKTDGTGKMQWNKTYGGASDDLGLNVFLSAERQLLLVGNAYDWDDKTADLKGKKFDVAVLRLNPADGGIQNIRLFGGSGVDLAFGVVMGKNNDLAITGVTDSNDGSVKGAKGGKDGLFLHLTPDELKLAQDEVNKVRIFPNPAQDQLFFDQPVTGMLFSELGVPVQALNKATNLNIGTLPLGLYFVRIDATGQVFRLVKADTGGVKISN